MGCGGGAVWHAFRGYRNSPRGHRLRGGYYQMLLRAPALGGNFAVWAGLFSAFDCAFIAVRRREDPLNAIAAGAFTGGMLAARAGVGAMGKNALVGGCLLALIEGVGFAVGRAFTPSSSQQQQQQQQAMLTPPAGRPLPVPAAVPLLPLSKTLSSDPALLLKDAAPIYDTRKEMTTEDFTYNEQADFEDEAF